MLVNQLRVVPTDETRQFLSSVLSGAPIELDLENLSVEIITTLDALSAKPANVYEATALHVRVWFDSYLQQSSLIVSLQSNDLNARVLELHQEGVVREFYDYYNPYLVLKRGMPPLSRHYRTFVLQAANSLCANERPLYFTGEFIQEVDLAAAPDYEYNEAMATDRGIRRNV